MNKVQQLRSKLPSTVSVKLYEDGYWYAEKIGEEGITVYCSGLTEVECLRSYFDLQ
jgi:hypothetical protein